MAQIGRPWITGTVCDCYTGPGGDEMHPGGASQRQASWIFDDRQVDSAYLQTLCGPPLPRGGWGGEEGGNEIYNLSKSGLPTTSAYNWDSAPAPPEVSTLMHGVPWVPTLLVNRHLRTMSVHHSIWGCPKLEDRSARGTSSQRVVAQEA